MTTNKINPIARFRAIALAFAFNVPAFRRLEDARKLVSNPGEILSDGITEQLRDPGNDDLDTDWTVRPDGAVCVEIDQGGATVLRADVSPQGQVRVTVFTNGPEIWPYHVEQLNAALRALEVEEHLGMDAIPENLRGDLQAFLRNAAQEGYTATPTTTPTPTEPESPERIEARLRAYVGYCAENGPGADVYAWATVVAASCHHYTEPSTEHVMAALMLPSTELRRRLRSLARYLGMDEASAA